MPLEIEIFPCRSDNYGYLIHDSTTGATAAIDAPEEKPIREALTRRGWTLSDILVTHHHADHTEAIAPLKDAFGARVTGPKRESTRIAGLDVLVDGGDEIRLGDTALKVYATPGHTLGHIVYHDPEGSHLFTADALFSLGCGRMFEGTPGPMWDGLRALRDLPDDTLVYCGHEYSAANARFALSIDPDNPDLKARAEEIGKQLAAGKFTVPVRLGTEKKANPFLRADVPAMANLVGMPGAEADDVFAAIRRAKDNF